MAEDRAEKGSLDAIHAGPPSKEAGVPMASDFRLDFDCSDLDIPASFQRSGFRRACEASAVWGLVRRLSTNYFNAVRRSRTFGSLAITQDADRMAINPASFDQAPTLNWDWFTHQETNSFL